MQLSDKEKLMIHASCALALALERGATDLTKAYNIIEAMRKNKIRGVSERESDEIVNDVLNQFSEMAPFLKMYMEGDIPD